MKTNDKVRVIEPNWSGPSAIKYTIVAVIDSMAILRRPILPGLPESEGLIERPLDRLVNA